MYAISRVETGLPEDGTAERLRTPVENQHWSPRVNEATIYVTFEETTIWEAQIGIVSDLNFTLWGYNEDNCEDEMLIGEKEEKAASKGYRLCKCVNADVSSSQFRDMRFTKAKLALTSENGLELAFFSLFRKGETTPVPAIIPPGYNLKRRVEDTSHIIPYTKKAKRSSPTRISPSHTVSIPKIPTSSAQATKPTRILRKGPIVSTDPAETSYSALLADCVVTCLANSEHIQRLCECLGACYLDHLEATTTHVVLPASLEYDEEALRKTEAKLVSVEWLEKCLGEKRRQREEDYQVL